MGKERDTSFGQYDDTEAAAYIQSHINGESDGVTCWRSSDVEVRTEGSIEGRGLFSVDKIPKGKIVAVKLGRVVSDAYIHEHADMIQGSHQVLGNNRNLAGTTPDEVAVNLVGYNHTCEDPAATVHVVQQPPMALVISRREVQPDEEIAVDYSLVMSSDTQNLDGCRCGTESCRHTIRPATDWQDLEFRESHKGEFANYIQEMIDDEQINLK